MTLFTVTMVSLFSLAVSGVVLALGNAFHSTWAVVIGCLLFVASIAFELVMHRCPYCRTYIKIHNYSYCPYCGEEIAYEDKFYLREKDRPEKKDE